MNFIKKITILLKIINDLLIKSGKFYQLFSVALSVVLFIFINVIIEKKSAWVHFDAKEKKFLIKFSLQPGMVFIFLILVKTNMPKSMNKKLSQKRLNI